MSTKPPPNKYQKDYFTPKGTFDRMRNPAAGSGRVMPTSMIKNILGFNDNTPEDVPPPAHKPVPAKPAMTDGYVILHWQEKYWNEELYVRATDDRPAWIFVHYPLALFNEILKRPFSPDSTQLDTPVSFTFYLAYKGKQPDVIFSVKCPIKGAPGSFVNLYFDNSYIPPKPDVGNSAHALGADAEGDNTTYHALTSQAEAGTPGCPNPDECMGIAAVHSIRTEVFQQNLTNFWDVRPVPKAFIISWNTLQQLLDDPDRLGMQVRLLWEDHDFNSNNMDFGFEPDPYAAAPKILNALRGRLRATKALETETEQKTSYSFKLFYGIYHLNTTLEIRLYKGQNDDGTRTILIESVGTRGHSYFDLSNEHP